MLVAVASRHGSTFEIAQTIGDELRTAGCAVDVQAVDAVGDMTGYDAVVLGSAIYMGKWLPEARRFADVHRVQLAAMPVWLFSSGPLGAPEPRPAEDPVDLPALLEATGARDHQIFVGKLDTRQLRMSERLMVKMVKAPDGDFRDWTAIRNWAHEIGCVLLSHEAAVG